MKKKTEKRLADLRIAPQGILPCEARIGLVTIQRKKNMMKNRQEQKDIVIAILQLMSEKQLTASESRDILFEA